jgi:BASS family bile acid:Na+ symporter
MTAADLIRTTLVISLACTVFAVGMACTLGAATYVLRQRALLVRSVLAMNILLPIIAIAIAAGLQLRPDVKIALIALAVSPVPPILPPRQLELVTHQAYVYGLLVATSTLSIVLVPLTMATIGLLFGRDLSVPPLAIARTVLMSTLAPLAVGMLVRRVWPDVAARLAPKLSAVATVVLLIGLAVILIAGRIAFVSLIGDGTLLVFAIFALIGLAVGHALGGPDRDDRAALALACASRHPGVAIAIGAALFPGEKLVAAAVLLSVLIGSIVSIPYTMWRRRVHARASPVIH